MNKEDKKMFEQIESLINDRKSLLGTDEEINKILENDIHSLEQIIKIYKEYKKENKELKNNKIKNDKLINSLNDFNYKLKQQYELLELNYLRQKKENKELKKQLGDRTKYVFVTECSAEQNSYFMPLAEYLDMKELPEDYEDIEYVELTDEELDYLEDCCIDEEFIDFLNIVKYNKIKEMFESGSVDLEELKNIVLGDE